MDGQGKTNAAIRRCRRFGRSEAGHSPEDDLSIPASGTAERFGVRPGGGVLLYGPPGTGKTMLAKATAGEIDASFFRISPADVLSKWVGEAEQNIKKLFDAAAAEPRSIIFIDEIEALVPARKDDGSSVMQRVVPQILQGMEGFDKKKNSAPSCSWAQPTSPGN